MQPIHEGNAGESRIGVSRRRRSDVVAFAVEDRYQTAVAGAAKDPLQGRQSGRAAHLEERALRFDHRHERRDHVDDAGAKFFKRAGQGRQGAVAVPRHAILPAAIPSADRGRRRRRFPWRELRR